MAIDWNAFFANGGFSNENSDPLSYDDGEDIEDFYDQLYEYNDWRNDNL